MKKACVMCIFVCNQLCLYLSMIMKLFFTVTDKDHQATNNTTSDRINEAEANGSVMKNRNSTTGVNLTSTTAADVKNVDYYHHRSSARLAD